jgi:hypothetical protein
MRALAALSVIAAALAIAPLAAAGGWASVGFEPLPDGTSAGGTWTPTIFVKQHGVTPLSGLQPTVTITDDRTGESSHVLATAGDEPGEYRAAVVFPSEGDWRVAIHSGFGDSQVTYGPFAIGAPASPRGDGSELPVVGLGAVFLAAALGIALLVARRSRRLTPAS